MVKLSTYFGALAISGMVAATPVSAQELDTDGGLYLKGFGGLSFLLSSDVSVTGFATQPDLSFDSGVIAGGAAGYRFYDSGFAAELEYAYRSGDTSDFAAGFGTGGDFASTSVMINGLYYFDGIGSGRITPYVGLGVGVLTEIDFDIENGAAAGEYSDRGGIAFQAMAGLEFDLTERFSLTGEARYFTAGTPDLDGPNGTVLNSRYNSADVLVGLKYKF